MLLSYWSGRWIILHLYQIRGSEIAALTWTDSHVCLQSCPRPLRKRQIIEHQMAIQLELSIMTWVSSDPSSHKTGWGQQQFILNWKWHSQDWAWAILEYTDKLQEALGQIHVSATTVSQQQFSLTYTSTWDSWEIPHDPLMENNPQAWFMGRLVWYRNESYTPTVTATPPHSEVSFLSLPFLFPLGPQD